MFHLWCLSSSPLQSQDSIDFRDQAPLPGRRQEFREQKKTFGFIYLMMVMMMVVTLTMMMVVMIVVFGGNDKIPSGDCYSYNHQGGQCPCPPKWEVHLRQCFASTLLQQRDRERANFWSLHHTIVCFCDKTTLSTELQKVAQQYESRIWF